MDKNLTCIWLKGDTVSKGKWIEWYQDMANIIRRLGFEPNIMCGSFDDYEPQRWLTVARKEKAILRRVEEGDIPISLKIGYREDRDSWTWIEIWRRNRPLLKDMVLMMDTSECCPIDPEEIVATMLKYIDIEYGEIFRCGGTFHHAGAYMVNRELSFKPGWLARNGTSYRNGVETLKIYKGEKHVE